MATVYTDSDADLTVLKDRTVGIVGYGNQGRAQALNLRDSGIDVLVGCPPDAYRGRAMADGLAVCDVRDAAERADIVLMLIPDEVQPDVYVAEVAPGLEAGNTLGFASGYNIHYGLIEPDADVDVVMVAPRMIGDAVRSLFLAGTGFPCLVAVGQNPTGQAMAKALALARAIGGTRQGAFESSFEEETLIDLFAEQFLWAGIGGLCRTYFDSLVDAGCDPEIVASEMYLSGEMVEVAQAMIDVGFFKQLDLHSHTSQYGQLSRVVAALGGDLKERAARILDGLRSGAFAEEWTAEQKAGCPALQALKREAFGHPLNRVEERAAGRTAK